MATGAVFGVVRPGVIEMKFVDVLELHVPKFGQVRVRDGVIRDRKGRFDG